MYPRKLKNPLEQDKSFFLFGARGTGKSTWLKSQLQDSALFFDLLNSQTYLELLSNPSRLENKIPKDFQNWIVIDEIQKIPSLLDEVHRLIENQSYKFVLTGSSARKLKTCKANMLAGRAYNYQMYPFLSSELGDRFSLKYALQYGMLPGVYADRVNEKDFLKSYLETYIRQEVIQEGLIRNLDSFARFLEAASFSQAQILNTSEVARDASVNRKTVEGYFDLLEDLLIAYRLPVFARRAKRKLINHSKFFFFDAGVFRSIRPSGPLDIEDEILGPSLETLVLQELIALNSYLGLDYEIFYWRTANGQEVDFVLYEPRGLIAIEVKKSHQIKSSELKSLQLFQDDYPEAKLYFLYSGSGIEFHGSQSNINCLPFEKFFSELEVML